MTTIGKLEQSRLWDEADAAIKDRLYPLAAALLVELAYELAPRAGRSNGKADELGVHTPAKLLREAADRIVRAAEYRRLGRLDEQGYNVDARDWAKRARRAHDGTGG
tara:strand:+ start:1242 stop:1562 length:321 start_codon:yes stop_codon:yes gene_type:complete